jgi:hypothetical protein
MARCATCGAELLEGSERFCGGDRCRRVLMKPPDQGGARDRGPRHHSRSAGTHGRVRLAEEVGDEVAPGVLQREAGNLGALRY